jgi:uncharacterized membrane protein YGL010W
VKKDDELLHGVLERRLEDYDGYHQHPKNRALHAIGIPLIVIGIAGLVGKAEFITKIPFAVICIVAMAIWLAVNCGTLMCAAMTILYMLAVFVGTATPMWVLLPGLATGIALLLVGHIVFEKRSPAFLTNAGHLLIGPVHLVVQLFEGPSSVPPSRRYP